MLFCVTKPPESLGFDEKKHLDFALDFCYNKDYMKIDDIVDGWKIIQRTKFKVQNGGGYYYLCECIYCDARAEIAEGTLRRGDAQCWKCTLANKKTSFVSVCKNGHDVQEWGRTPTGACRGCVKHKSLLRAYGLTLDAYMALYRHQKGLCAVCGKELGPYLPLQQGYYRSSRIEVDHDHRLTGRESVRGLLCGGRWAGCNRKLGRIDNAPWLRRVLAYIENPPAKGLDISSKV